MGPFHESCEGRARAQACGLASEVGGVHPRLVQADHAREFAKSPEGWQRQNRNGHLERLQPRGATAVGGEREAVPEAHH